MSDFVLLRGYAVPFNQTVLLASTGTYERISSTAFDRLLSRGRASIDIRWGSHDHDAPTLASTRNGSAGFFVDNYGLAFWARLDMRGENGRWGLSPNYGRLTAITQRGMDRCSIGGLHIAGSSKDRHLGATRETISSAEIDHVTISSRVSYCETGVWRTDDDLTLARYGIQLLAERWGQGRRSLTPVARFKPPAAPSKTPGVPAKVAAMLAPRMALFHDVRERVATAFERGEVNSVVFAHLAFSRAGGFDGNWEALSSTAQARLRRSGC